MNTQDRSESAMTTYARATAAFLAMLVIGYAVSATQVPTDAVRPVIAQQDLTPTPYFPSQYVNQGRTTEDHIQAF